MSSLACPELDELLGQNLFEQVPFNIAIIDRDFNVVAANRSFREFFGEWRGRKCHQVFKGSPEQCTHCRARAVFEDGLVRVSDETGVDRHGRRCHYVVHLAPLRDASGQIRYVIEMTTDLTETRQWQRQYDLFFERVPCFVTVIDRDFRIVRANEKFRETFGEVEGRHCYELYKRRAGPCRDCPAARTFADGREHTSREIGVQKEGRQMHYVVTTTPLSRTKGTVEHVIEMATDITPVRELEDKLKQTHAYYTSLIQNSATGIVAVDTEGRVRIFNPAARSLLGWTGKRAPRLSRLRRLLPAEFFDGDHREGAAEPIETSVRTVTGEEVPVRFSAIRLAVGKHPIGRAAFLEDLRQLRRLEQEKLEAERLAAVGQTVAGLAHTIKNLLMGLEGGMYMLDSGLKRGDASRILGGWDVLQRNFEKTTALVKDFLSFAKGRLPELEPTDPNALAAAIVDLYREAAQRQGVQLVLEAGANVRPAPLDPRGMETALTNLISNGIDAAVMRDQPGGRVVVRTREENDELIFEVADNGCGMDWEVKSKIFTTFFTTKGGKGTGLGLLTTRKIIQEHGGRIEADSTPGVGTTFRIRLSRKRLEALARAAAGNGQQGNR